MNREPSEDLFKGLVTSSLELWVVDWLQVRINVALQVKRITIP